VKEPIKAAKHGHGTAYSTNLFQRQDCLHRSIYGYVLPVILWHFS